MKKLFFIGLLLFGLVLFLNSAKDVSALDLCNITHPTSGEVVIGQKSTPRNYSINISCGGIVAEGNWSCEIYFRANNTANKTTNNGWLLIANVTNTSPIGNLMNFTFNANYPNFEDTNNAEIWAKCYNLTWGAGGSETTSNTTNTSIIVFVIDNTAPYIRTLTPADGTTDEDGDVTWTVNSGYTNVSSLSTSSVLYFVDKNPGMRSYGLTEESSSLTKTINGMGEQRYNWYITLTDGRNSSTISPRELIIAEPPSSSRRLGAAQEIARVTPGIEQVGPRTFSVQRQGMLGALSVWGDSLISTKWGPMAPIVWIFLGVILILGGYFYFKKK